MPQLQMRFENRASNGRARGNAPESESVEETVYAGMRSTSGSYNGVFIDLRTGSKEENDTIWPIEIVQTIVVPLTREVTAEL